MALAPKRDLSRRSVKLDHEIINNALFPDISPYQSGGYHSRFCIRHILDKDLPGNSVPEPLLLIQAAVNRRSAFFGDGAIKSVNTLCQLVAILY